jgi:RecB family exonuclease
VEEERMRQVLRAWVELEKSRPDFVVAEREAVRQLVVGGLTMNVRVDRLDRLPDGGALLIDYKSGRSLDTGLSRLYEERLMQPQLPLYALACPEARGVCYAELDRGKCRMQGVAAEEGAAPGVKQVREDVGDWESLRALWRKRLGALAEEFTAGRADADPKAKSGCGYCEQASLCRYDAEPLEPGEEGQ